MSLDDDQTNVPWCMYILETSISFGTSQIPPPLPSIEMPMPSEQPGNPGRGYFLAMIKLSQLWARIQQDLLARQIAPLSGSPVQSIAIGYLEELQTLQASLGIDTSPFAACITMDPSQLSVTYTVLTMRLVINEAFSPTSNNSGTFLSDARSAAGILTSMGRDTSDNLGNYALLPR